MTMSMTRTWLATAAMLLVATAAYAHVTVTPQQSSVGATQVYKVRIHAEGKTATAGIELDIPEGVTVIQVAKPSAGTFETVKADSRITVIKWTIDIAPGKLVELAFTAKNPAAGTALNWVPRQRLADGSVEDWAGKTGTQTKLNPTGAASAAKKSYEFYGKVVSVDAQAKTLKVDGEDVKGWMAAMTMSYAVDKPDVLSKLKAGDRIVAKVYDGDTKTLYNVEVEMGMDTNHGAAHPH
ncbi:MAG: DUF1775 domain-containing protein [Acidobacteria bacterium]|nr:DUF1775 domain-containing protein [Acidobacteriota bacterium]